MDSQLLKSIPLGLLCLVITKLLVVGSSAPDAAIVAVLAALVAGASVIDNNKHRKNIQSKIDELEKSINSKQEQIEQHTKDIEQVKTFAQSIRISAAMKPKF